MCTSIIEIARAEGMAKRGDEWCQRRTSTEAKPTSALCQETTSRARQNE